MTLVHLRDFAGQPRDRNQVPCSVPGRDRWRILVKRLCRNAFLTALALICLHPAFVSGSLAAASEAPAQDSAPNPTPKKKVKKPKYKKYKGKKAKVLKSRHEKHARKPA